MKSLSYSQLATAYTCFRKYKYLYVDKLVADVPDSVHLQFGTAIHGAVQASIEGASGTEVFNLFWDSLKDKELRGSGYSWEQLREQGGEFIRKFDKKHLATLKPTVMEERLYGEYKGYKLEGTPDFIGLHNGIPTLVDFKTSSYNYSPDKLISNPQMYLYAYLAKQKGYEISQLMYLVFVKGRDPRIQEPLIIPLEEARMMTILDNVRDMCQDLENRTNFPGNFNSCLFGKDRCEYWDICHKGGQK